MHSGEDLNETDASIAIIGDDSESSVVLTVHTPLTGFVFDVEVVRISKSSIKEMNHIFECLTQLKISSIRNEPLEQNAVAGGQLTTRQIADRAWQNLSTFVLEL